MQICKKAFILAALTVAAPGAAQEAGGPDVKQILRDADAATKAVRAVSYEAEFHAKGSLAERLPVVTAKVIARKPLPSFMQLVRVGKKMPLVHIWGTIKRPSCDESLPFELVTNRGEAIIIDPVHKRVNRGRVAFEHLPLAEAGRPLMIEFVVSNPFCDELNGRSALHEGVKEVGGVACDVIFVVYANKTETRWYLSQEDHLPRRVERIGPDGVVVLTVSNLDTKPALGPTVFQPEYPAEYEVKHRVPVEVDPKVLKDLVGTYRINEWQVREVAVKDGRLYTRRSGSTWLGLVPASETRFYYMDTFSSLTFHKDENGKVTHHVLDHLFGVVEKAVKIDQAHDQKPADDE